MATLTSTTAPGKMFSSRSELAEHYKSDWHKYNLKRREAGLPLLAEPDFTARWEAALALRKEKERERKKNGEGHLKNRNRNKTKSKQKSNNTGDAGGDADGERTEASERLAKVEGIDEMDLKSVSEPSVAMNVDSDNGADNADLYETQENPDIDPNQSLFDSHKSPSMDENVRYMQQQFGFFLPDKEHISDLEGLLGYCHEKIKLGHYCLYCEKLFPTWQGCQKHMVSKSHAKLRYEPGHWDEFEVFYDFSCDNESFLKKGCDSSVGVDDDNISVDAESVEDNAEGEGGWEDVPETDSAVENGNESNIFDEYEREVARFGLDVTPLGELIFSDGRIVGHRALRKYYRQRPNNASRSNPAILAAQKAAGDRLYQGTLVNIGKVPIGSQQKGIGKGILVKTDDKTGFSALSLYRFRAVVQKQRKEDDMSRRTKHRSILNINRMDKKANRLMNNVSVAHAKR